NGVCNSVSECRVSVATRKKNPPLSRRGTAYPHEALRCASSLAGTLLSLWVDDVEPRGSGLLPGMGLARGRSSFLGTQLSRLNSARNGARRAAALNRGMGSSSLKADVKAFERLH